MGAAVALIHKGNGMSYRFNKSALLAGTVMAGAMIATPVVAQTTDNDTAVQAEPAVGPDNFIVVTGSRIQRRNVESAAPVAVVNAEEFELSGTVNVENVINTLPQVIPGTTSFSNNPGTGASTLNLRGLGTPRTLVLVNGRRWMSYDTNQIVDLNTIPSFLIDSVDVVTGGASAVYGSDALAGVVNFRLKQVDGIELGGQYNLTERGDGARYEVHGAIGTSFDDGRGSATVFAEYYNRKPIFQSGRKFSNFALGGESFDAPLQRFGSGTPPEGRVNVPGTATVRNAIDLNGDGDRTDPGEAAVTRPIGAGLVLDDGLFRTPGVATPTAGNSYNYAPANYLQLPQERYLIGGYADYEFSDGHTAYTEVSFVNNRVAQELAATPVTGTFNVNIAAVSPFLSAAVINELNIIDQREAAASAERVANGLSALPAAQLGVISTAINRRTIESGSRNSLDERNAFRVLGGVRGGITETVNYDAYYMYARTRNANIQAGNISRSAFQRGLDGTDAAINIFGLGQLSQTSIDQISIQAQNGDVSTTQVASGVISGTFGDFAIGGASPIGFAIGAEYRKVGSEFLPDTALSSGDVIGFNAGDATEGSYNVKEVFGELNVPIFETDGGTRLSLTGAGRISDYSLEAVGTTYTYAGGVEFSPIADVTFRGQYQRAVRAPNVAELFQGQAIGFPGVVDPCANAGTGAVAATRATCIALGVPAGNVGQGLIVQPNAQIPALFGGNPNLEEETSDSFTAGIVLQPSFLPGFTLTADYFDITIDNAIASVGGSPQGAFDLCFVTIADPTSAACDAFRGVRNGDGAIVVDNPPLISTANISSLGVSGVDLEANYTTTIPFSLLTDTGEQRVSLSFLGTWTDRAFVTPVVGVDDTVECAGKFGGRCGEPTPSFKWTSRASFIDGPLTTSLRWRHLSAVDDEDIAVLYSDFNGVERIPAYDLFDLTMSFEANENLTLTFGVNNIFDKLPMSPEFNAAGEVSNANNGTLLGDNQEQANTYPSTFDVLGRDFFVSAKMKF